MFVSMRMIFYICTVKSQLRYIAAAISSVFCASDHINRYSRIKVWVSSNAPKVFAVENLTTPWTAFLFNVKFQLL